MTGSVQTILAESLLLNPIRFLRDYDRKNLRPDVMAGVTVAVILLPQAIAFALIAELPPEMGLYAAIVAAVTGALWGSSSQIHTGPTNALSLLVLSALLATNTSGTQDFILAAGLLAVMVGVFQAVLGLAGLGALVNFVSHSVIVGFASGAGLLIAVKQLQHLLGLKFKGGSATETFEGLAAHFPETNLPTFALGVGVIGTILLIRRIRPSLPSALIAMTAASLAVYLLDLERLGVAVLGKLPSGLPPLANLPLLNLEMLSRLSVGALAVGAIGLVETSAIAKSIAGQTGQRLDSNQEFVGQGLANVAAGLFSGYPCAGSFSRSAVNFKAGAQTQMAAIFSALFVLAAVFLLGPLATYLPVSALAGVLIVTAFGMIDYAEIGRIYKGARSDTVILVTTFLGTVFLNIEFAVLTGILLSFAFYIMKTSVPRVEAVLPDRNFRHFSSQGTQESCPQLGIIEIRGDLYFGAVGHVEKEIRKHRGLHPEQRFLLLRMKGVNHCDFSGIHTLESIVRLYRDDGGDVYLTRVSRALLRLMIRTGFHNHLGRGHFLHSDNALDYLFHRVIDPAICIYECPVRAFRECQNLPKREIASDLAPHTEAPSQELPRMAPRELWERLHGDSRPLVIDVREAREFQGGHIAEARLLPLPELLSDASALPRDRTLVLVCRGGRRSARAAAALADQGYNDVFVLTGGMLGWEAARLLEAVEE